MIEVGLKMDTPKQKLETFLLHYDLFVGPEKYDYIPVHYDYVFVDVPTGTINRLGKQWHYVVKKHEFKSFEELCGIRKTSHRIVKNARRFYLDR